jgi:glycosyltransferase involved in cell wall biosynthesis
LTDKNKNLLVTVFMTAYNSSPYIGEAIHSILNQSYPYFEFIIVNDGSTDNTQEIIDSFDDKRIKCIQNPTNQGLSISRNIALKEANGVYLAILDSDDIAFPERLEKQVNHLENTPDLAVLGGKAVIIDSFGNETGEILEIPHQSENVHALLFFKNKFVHSSVMMRTAVFKEMGGYQSEGLGEDYDLFVRISHQYKVDNLPEYLVAYRKHPTNISKTGHSDEHRELFPIKAKQLKALHIPAEIEYLHILISDIRKLNYSVAYFADFYCLLIEQNLKLKLYHPDLFGRLIFQQWYDVVRLKSESNALLLLFKKPIFKWKYVTFKQIRKTFKLSLKYLFRIKK